MTTPGITVVVPDLAALPSPALPTLVSYLGGGRIAVSEEGSPARADGGPQAVAHLSAPEEQVLAAFPGCWVYRTAVHVVFDRLDGATNATARTVVLQRNPALDHDGFVHRWTVGHAELARRHHPGIGRYVQRVVVEALTPDAPPADGVACLAYATEDDLALRQYDSPEGKAIIQEDVAGFLDRSAGTRVFGPELEVEPAPPLDGDDRAQD